MHPSLHHSRLQEKILYSTDNTLVYRWRFTHDKRIIVHVVPWKHVFRFTRKYRRNISLLVVLEDGSRKKSYGLRVFKWLIYITMYVVKRKQKSMSGLSRKNVLTAPVARTIIHIVVIQLLRIYIRDICVFSMTPTCSTK